MPSKRTGKRNVAQDCNEALELLRLQQYTDKVTTTKNALEEIQELMQGQTIPANFTSAHDHRTLKAAHSCLNSLRIRLEAHVNTVEQTVNTTTIVFDFNNCARLPTNHQHPGGPTL